MQVKCIGNKGKDISDKLLNTGYCSITTEFYLKLEKIYVVYGIYTSNDGFIFYLLQDLESGWPDWYPAELFIVIDHILPLEWSHNFFDYNNSRSAIFGYKELNFDHYVGLIEREDKDKEIFLKRKKEIDEFAELMCYKGK